MLSFELRCRKYVDISNIFCIVVLKMKGRKMCLLTKRLLFTDCSAKNESV